MCVSLSKHSRAGYVRDQYLTTLIAYAIIHSIISWVYILSKIINFLKCFKLKVNFREKKNLEAYFIFFKIFLQYIMIQQWCICKYLRIKISSSRYKAILKPFAE